jgi:hypothetical protein
MADNVDLDAGSGGATIKTDDDGTAHWQYVKMSFGPDNTQTRVTASVGLPVDLLAGTAEIGNVKNAGTFAVQAVCTNGGTFATQATLQAGTAEIGKLAAGTAEIGNITNSGTFAVQIDKFTAAAALTDNFANPTTTAVQSFGMLWDGATWDRMLGNSTDGVLVNLGSNNDISGTVTSNAGTNLNTSALALETGGNLATLAGAVSGTEVQVDVVASLPTGTNSIGQVTANAGSGNFSVNNGGTFATQATLQTGSNTIGEVTVGAATGATGDLAKTQDVAMGANDVGVAMLAVRDDEQAAMTPADGDYTTLRTDRFGNLKVTNLPDATSVVKFGVINVAGSGDNTLQSAAGAGIKIRVLSVMMVSAGTVTARFESGAAGTALTGQMNLVANSGFTLPYNPAGWFETADNVLLNLELSGAISVDGCFTYVEV